MRRPHILLETDGSGALLARYARGDRVDQPLAMHRAGQDYYLHADHQGSIVRVTDAAGVGASVVGAQRMSDPGSLPCAIFS